MPKTIAGRLRAMADIIPGGGCWLYRGATHPVTGYVQISIGRGPGRKRYIHRVAYETFVGPIPDGLQIDHLCRVRHCFNPDHLEPVTPSENTRRSYAARRQESAA